MVPDFDGLEACGNRKGRPGKAGTSDILIVQRGEKKNVM